MKKDRGVSRHAMKKSQSLSNKHLKGHPDKEMVKTIKERHKEALASTPARKYVRKK